MGKTTELKNKLSSLFPKNVEFDISEITDNQSDLLQQEADQVKTYSSKRLHEFSTARVLSRSLLRNYGIDDFPLLSDKNRAPIWPEDIIGSITHCKDLCGVAVSRPEHFASIGFDMENIREVNLAIRKFVCTEEEDHWLLLLPESMRIVNLLLIFSIKEALYKCIYQASGDKINFKTFTAIPISDSESFNLKAVDTGYIPLQNIHTRYIATDKHVFTFCYV